MGTCMTPVRVIPHSGTGSSANEGSNDCSHSEVSPARQPPGQDRFPGSLWSSPSLTAWIPWNVQAKIRAQSLQVFILRFITIQFHILTGSAITTATSRHHPQSEAAEHPS